MRLTRLTAPIAALAAAGAAVAALLLARRSRAAGATLGPGVLAAAEADLGVAEDIAKNDGHRIREYFEGSGIEPPANWCAAAVTFWVRAAARAAGVAPPVGSMQAKKIMDQLRALGTWRDGGALRADPSLIRPGMVVVWDRSDPARPETSWWGHVGVVARGVEGGEFETVEGNSGPAGDRVARVRRRPDDPRLLGAGEVPSGPAASRARRLSRPAVGQGFRGEAPEGAEDGAPAPAGRAVR